MTTPQSHTPREKVTVADQSALYGLLRKLSDLGVPLLSVKPTHPNNAEAPASTTPTEHTRRSTT